MKNTSVLNLLEEIAQVNEGEGAEALTQERLSELCKKYDVSTTEFTDLVVEILSAGEIKSFSNNEDALGNVAGGKMNFKKGAATLLAALNVASPLAGSTYAAPTAASTHPANVARTTTQQANKKTSSNNPVTQKYNSAIKYVQNKLGISRPAAEAIVDAVGVIGVATLTLGSYGIYKKVHHNTVSAKLKNDLTDLLNVATKADLTTKFAAILQALQHDNPLKQPLEQLKAKLGNKDEAKDFLAKNTHLPDLNELTAVLTQIIETYSSLPDTPKVPTNQQGEAQKANRKSIEIIPAEPETPQTPNPTTGPQSDQGQTITNNPEGSEAPKSDKLKDALTELPQEKTKQALTEKFAEIINDLQPDNPLKQPLEQLKDKLGNTDDAKAFLAKNTHLKDLTDVLTKIIETYTRLSNDEPATSVQRTIGNPDPEPAQLQQVNGKQKDPNQPEPTTQIPVNQSGQGQTTPNNPAVSDSPKSATLQDDLTKLPQEKTKQALTDKFAEIIKDLKHDHPLKKPLEQLKAKLGNKDEAKAFLANNTNLPDLKELTAVLTQIIETYSSLPDTPQTPNPTTEPQSGQGRTPNDEEKKEEEKKKEETEENEKTESDTDDDTLEEEENDEEEEKKEETEENEKTDNGTDAAPVAEAATPEHDANTNSDHGADAGRGQEDHNDISNITPQPDPQTEDEKKN